MADIYEQAEEVLVWLGKDGFGDAQTAVDLMLAVNHFFDTAYVNGDYSDEEGMLQVPEDSLLLKDSRWMAAFHMFDMPWFTRVWVIQEIGVAGTATPLFGDASIP